MNKLDQLLGIAADNARKELLDDKVDQLMTTWTLLRENDQLEVLGTPWANNVEKRIMLNLVRLYVRTHDIVAYSILTEAWMANLSEKDLAEEDLPRASEAINRQEVVIAMATDGKEVKMRKWLILRDWKNKIKELREEELKEFDRLESDFMGFIRV